jgi:hypothetical protein
LFVSHPASLIHSMNSGFIILLGGSCCVIRYLVLYSCTFFFELLFYFSIRRQYRR